MIKMPMMAGPTIADVVLWRFDRGSMLWAAELPDGSILRARYKRQGTYGKNSYWRAEATSPFDGGLHGAWVGDDHHVNADLAEQFAFDEWSRRRSRVRDKAVEIVDRRHGYTYEHAPCPDQHVAEYDLEEAKLLGVDL